MMHHSGLLYLIVREAATLLSHEATEERHRDEEEEDDEEDCATDHPLRLWPDRMEIRMSCNNFSIFIPFNSSRLLTAGGLVVDPVIRSSWV